MTIPTGAGNYPAGVTDNDAHFERDADLDDETDAEKYGDPAPEAPRCERCEQRPVSEACEEGLYCDVCLDNMAEAAAEEAHERAFTSYWEGNGPMTLDEQHAAAWDEKQALRRGLK